eukprot:366534-Chlamydomonas_euryale.AAC.7
MRRSCAVITRTIDRHGTRWVAVAQFPSGLQGASFCPPPLPSRVFAPANARDAAPSPHSHPRSLRARPRPRRRTSPTSTPPCPSSPSWHRSESWISTRRWAATRSPPTSQPLCATRAAATGTILSCACRTEGRLMHVRRVAPAGGCGMAKMGRGGSACLMV